jgi:hypothetical protein
MSDFVSSDVALLRRNRLILAAALAPLLIGPLSLAWGALTPGDPARAVGLTVGLICSLVGAVSSFFVIRASPFKVAVPGALFAGEHSVRFAGRMIASRRSLRAGFLIPTWGKPPLVRLERRWPRRPIELQVSDEPSGRALLHALGFDASQVVASFTFASRARADPRIGAVGSLMLLLMFISFAMLAANSDSPGSRLVFGALVSIATLIGWTVLIWMPTRVVVGTDGVLVSWFWRRRFVSYSEVRAVRPFGSGTHQGVALWLSTATSIKLPLKRKLTSQLNDQETDLVTQRIQQAIASFHQKRRERDVALPERGPRSLKEWIRLLRAVGSGANADHRTAPIPREELFRIVEDPGAAPAERARAAVAIGGGLDDSGRSRLRIAAEATAAPEVRALLELSAEEADEAQIAEAFARIPVGGRQAAG